MRKNRENCGFLLLAAFLFFLPAALQGEEQGPWYLISETELQSIERYREQSEREKQNWLLQAQRLRAQAAGLQQESETLNNQLARQREQNQKLQNSFNEYEAEQLTLAATKNGEITGLKQAIADKAQEAEKYKGKAAVRMFVIIALAASWVIYIAVKVYLFFKP